VEVAAVFVAGATAAVAAVAPVFNEATRKGVTISTAEATAETMEEPR